jgi:hypothetical protein
MAVSFDVWVKVLSSPPPDLVVRLEESGVVEGEGEVNSAESFPIWAAHYGEGPQCGDKSETGLVHWEANAIQTGEETGWEGYLIEPEAITPNSNAAEAGDALVVFPHVFISNRPVEVNWNRHLSPNLVECFSSGGFGEPLPAVAVDPGTARELGCSG